MRRLKARDEAELVPDKDVEPLGGERIEQGGNEQVGDQAAPVRRLPRDIEHIEEGAEAGAETSGRAVALERMGWRCRHAEDSLITRDTESTWLLLAGTKS